jgi:hypothetical protein
MRCFVGIDLGCEPVPDEITVRRSIAFSFCCPTSGYSSVSSLSAIELALRKQQPEHRHITWPRHGRRLPGRDDDRELQTEQTIVGLPPRKLQPDRMDARS